MCHFSRSEIKLSFQGSVGLLASVFFLPVTLIKPSKDQEPRWQTHFVFFKRVRKERTVGMHMLLPFFGRVTLKCVFRY